MSQEIEKNAEIGMIPAMRILLPGLIDFIKQIVFKNYLPKTQVYISLDS